MTRQPAADSPQADSSLDAAAPGERRIGDRRRRRITGVLCGAMLVVAMTAVVVAYRHAAGKEPASLPTWLEIATAVIYFAALAAWCSRARGRWALAWILLVGAGMRIAVWFTPILPNGDYHRYLWDGAVTAARQNPYRYSPKEILADPAVRGPALERLTEAGRTTLLHISYPELRTIYPPLAQGLFAVAYWIEPFSLTSWRIVLLAFDALGAGLLLSLLRAANKPVGYLGVYLWNPLLIIETYYGGHLDLIAGVFVLLAVWCLARRYVTCSAAVLALGAGVKLWPALLIFIVLWAARKEPRRMATALGVFVGLTALIGAAYLPAFGADSSGLEAYSRRWLANPGAYLLIRELGGAISTRLGAGDARWIARAVVGILVAAFAMFKARRATCRAEDLCLRTAVVVLVMLLLSPTFYPWYYVSLIPLATLAPRASLLAWTVLLPLSYLPGYQSGNPGLIMILLIHLPVWGLLFGEWVAFRRPRPQRATSAHA